MIGYWNRPEATARSPAGGRVERPAGRRAAMRNGFLHRRPQEDAGDVSGAGSNIFRPRSRTRHRGTGGRGRVSGGRRAGRPVGERSRARHRGPGQVCGDRRPTSIACAGRVASYKRPRSVEFVDKLPNRVREDPAPRIGPGTGRGGAMSAARPPLPDALLGSSTPWPRRPRDPAKDLLATLRRLHQPGIPDSGRRPPGASQSARSTVGGSPPASTARPARVPSQSWSTCGGAWIPRHAEDPPAAGRRPRHLGLLTVVVDYRRAPAAVPAAVDLVHAVNGRGSASRYSVGPRPVPNWPGDSTRRTWRRRRWRPVGSDRSPRSAALFTASTACAGAPGAPPPGGRRRRDPATSSDDARTLLDDPRLHLGGTAPDSRRAWSDHRCRRPARRRVGGLPGGSRR
ncbi:hypothetical protein HBB16_19780 [Pseudonocardia sp. MCCB 268]|nr:hypothetical protein [Pseudonocardia cytotoxica]